MLAETRNRPRRVARRRDGATARRRATAREGGEGRSGADLVRGHAVVRGERLGRRREVDHSVEQADHRRAVRERQPLEQRERREHLRRRRRRRRHRRCRRFSPSHGAAHGDGERGRARKEVPREWRSDGAFPRTARPLQESTERNNKTAPPRRDDGRGPTARVSMAPALKPRRLKKPKRTRVRRRRRAWPSGEGRSGKRAFEKTGAVASSPSGDQNDELVKSVKTEASSTPTSASMLSMFG